MATKIRDIAVKTGEYQKDGETKGRWLNVGALMRNEEGGEFIIMERWFNPAGLPNPDNRNSIILSCFELREGGRSGSSEGGSTGGSGSARQSDKTKDDPFEDDLPFVDMRGEW